MRDVVQELQKYLIYKQSYSQFSVEICQFLLPRQQGSGCRKVNHSQIDWPPAPIHPVWCKNLGPSGLSNLSGFIENLLFKFADFSYHWFFTYLNIAVTCVTFTTFFLRVYVLSFYYCIVVVVNLFQTNTNEWMNEWPWQQGLVWHISLP